jgi:hypothetical protein
MGELGRIDAAGALDLLCDAVGRHGRRTTGAVDGGIVAAALSGAGAGGRDLAAVSSCAVRTLWVRDALPCPMTFGAVVVFNRAQQVQRAGATWGAAVAHAARSAQLLVDLVPLRAYAPLSGGPR